jgi:hypothetical protein
MATLSQMVDEVSLKLAGFTLRQDRQTYLTAPISVSDTEISVASATNISSGIIEIEDELIYVDSFDRTNKKLNIPPYGRAYSGTSATSHASGKKVTIAPMFPRTSIKQAINDTINSVFPSLYSVSSTVFKYKPAQTTYPLPANAEKVLSVSYESTGPSKQWRPVRGWRVDPMANIDAFNSTNSISILSGVEPGRNIQVTYTVEPSTMLADNGDFALTTGLPASSKDVVILGAAYRLASYVDPGRLTFGSAESDQQSQVAGRAYGAGTNAAKYLLALYNQRLMDEARKLTDKFPTRLHFTN